MILVRQRIQKKWMDWKNYKKYNCVKNALTILQKLNAWRLYIPFNFPTRTFNVRDVLGTLNLALVIWIDFINFILYSWAKSMTFAPPPSSSLLKILWSHVNVGFTSCSIAIHCMLRQTKSNQKSYQLTIQYLKMGTHVSDLLDIFSYDYWLSCDFPGFWARKSQQNKKARKCPNESNHSVRLIMKISNN